jgi:type III secretion protein F
MATSDFMNIGGDYSSSPEFDMSEDYQERDGFDLIWRQAELQNQMAEVEEDIRAIEANANLSDTEKMFALQMAANTWNAVASARTNILKCVSDVLKAIVRNVA